MFRRTCGELTRMLFSFACEAVGARTHPAFPAPSVFEGEQTEHQDSDAIAPREGGGVSLFCCYEKGWTLIAGGALPLPLRERVPSASEAGEGSSKSGTSTPHPARTCRCSPPSPARGEGKKTSPSSIGARMLAVGIVFERRRPYLAIEASGKTRADFASPAPRRGHRTNLLRGRGTPPRIIPASVRMLMMLSDMAAACLDAGGRHQRKCHGRRDGQCQKPDRIYPHSSLPCRVVDSSAHPVREIRVITCRPRYRFFDRDRH